MADRREPLSFPAGVLRDTRTGKPTLRRCLLDADVMSPLMDEREDYVIPASRRRRRHKPLPKPAA